MNDLTLEEMDRVYSLVLNEALAECRIMNKNPLDSDEYKYARVRRNSLITILDKLEEQ